MELDRSTAVTALLASAKEAHSIYEADALDGVYDDAWPRWYATYAVDHGLGEILGHEVGIDELTTFLVESHAAFAAADPTPADPWAQVVAARIVTEL